MGILATGDAGGTYLFTMLRTGLLLFALTLCAAASLTTVKAPDLFTWKVAILVGEFGQWLCLLALAAAAFALALPAAPGAAFWIQRVTAAACVVAAGFLVMPTVHAWRIGRTLPEALTGAFGDVPLMRPVFSVSNFVGLGDEPVAIESRIFAHAGTPDALLMDFYRAATAAPAPCVVVVHPGGWDSGDRKQLASLNHWLARRGYAVAAIDYRLAPKHLWPAQRDDVLAALAHLKKHAAALHLDPSRFVLLGRSAGGQIAEAVAYGWPDPTVRGVVALYSPADLHFAWQYAREDDVLNSFKLVGQYLGGSPETVRGQFDEASGYLHVNRLSVPTLLMHGKLDTLVWHRQSERLAARLADRGVPHVFLDLPWATHAFDFNLRGPGGQLGTFALEWFLAAVTKTKS
jgi:acetyl esterase/lipase